MSPGRPSSGLGFPPGSRLSNILHSVLQLQLSPVELSELHADLKLQERDEFSWKKLKAEGLDEDGEKEAKLIRNLNGIFPLVCTRGPPPGSGGPQLLVLTRAVGRTSSQAVWASEAIKAPGCAGRVFC